MEFFSVLHFLKNEKKLAEHRLGCNKKIMEIKEQNLFYQMNDNKQPNA